MEDDRQNSVREDLVAAFESQDVTDAESGQREAPQATEPTKVVEPEAKEPAQAAETKTEDKEPAAAETKTDEKSAESKIEAPARWTTEDKEGFEALSPDVQRILLSRNKGLESSYTKTMQQVAQERQRYHGIEESIAPHRQSWNQTGWDDATAITNIMSYWQHANQDPMGFLEQFAETRGLDLASHFAPSADEIMAYLQSQEGAGGEVPHQGGIHPDVQRSMQATQQEVLNLRQQLNNQQGHLSQQENMRLQNERNVAAQEIESFTNAVDENGQPKHEFLNELRADMSPLLANGMAQTLEEAYDKAMWMRPDIRNKVTESMQMKQRRDIEAQLRAEGDKARGASLSVVGGSSTPSAEVEDVGDGSVRSILTQQWRALAERDA